jgi:hypothetical protein
VHPFCNLQSWEPTSTFLLWLYILSKCHSSKT